jgi:hypothetical protein
MATPYVFVSHASVDKKHLQPLIEALALQGLDLWVDRPGPGENNFNFDSAFIDRYAIRGLRTGVAWDEQITDSIREAGAVLVCFSRAFQQESRVLMHELLLGQYQKKLVACVIDDLSFDELPGAFGLSDAWRMQAARIDLTALGRAVALYRQDVRHSGAADPTAFEQWQVVQRLTSEIDRLFDAAGGRRPSAEQMRIAREALAAIPIAPMVRMFEIPSEVITLFADRWHEPERAATFVALAMEIRLACNPEGFAERQIVLRNGELLNPRSVSAEEYWSVALSLAGMKSRRTLAALLLAPGAPCADGLPAATANTLSSFLHWLTQAHRDTLKEA